MVRGYRISPRKTSLQPERAAGQNASLIYYLYQGYRKVRGAGRKPLYMGFWDEGKMVEREDLHVFQEPSSKSIIRSLNRINRVMGSKMMRSGTS